jgi:hypothetical protein
VVPVPHDGPDPVSMLGPGQRHVEVVTVVRGWVESILAERFPQVPVVFSVFMQAMPDMSDEQDIPETEEREFWVPLVGVYLEIVGPEPEAPYSVAAVPPFKLTRAAVVAMLDDAIPALLEFKPSS